MIIYKGLSFHLNNKYNYIEYRLTLSDLINAERFISTLSLISEFLLSYKPQCMLLTLAAKHECNSTYIWFLNQIILPQLNHYGINNIALIVNPIIIKHLKIKFEMHTFIHLFSIRAEAINWAKGIDNKAVSNSV